MTMLFLRSDDALVRRKLEVLAGELGLELGGGGEDPPAAVVIDLERPGALEEVADLRARFPEAILAGHVGLPDKELWLGAERAGCDLVASRGAIAVTLRRRLSAPGGGGRRRLPLFATDDVAGRLGLVHRDAQSPVGPLAVYHLRGQLHAVEDRCPHAGATLSEGEVEGCVLTCPRHGSQFDVSDGGRVRGPADQGLRTFTLVEEGGQVYLLLPST
ncbi:MAG: Rieske 2Fe-2S domain-containing protein [Actinomycetota bacterium]|jgi:nitrite reductase/ring-hydroxylating ferredoxin subunit|nr:Rieske 2Fe-2S domain-containing protein [Actinomycetota bacterium]